jgi:hypothetical protein
MIALQITLPDDVAREANELGLFESAVLTELLREAIRQRRIAELFSAADKMAAMDDAPMSPEEIQAEIRAARATHRATCP